MILMPPFARAAQTPSAYRSRTVSGQERHCLLILVASGFARRATRLCLPSSHLLLARNLSDQICGGLPDSNFEEASSLWLNKVGAAQSQDNGSERLSTWLEPLLEKRMSAIESSLDTTADVARFRAAKTREASALYSSVPSSKDRTRLEDGALQVAIGVRLGLPIATSGVCICGAPLDPFGDHALTCRHSVGRHARHSAVNDLIKESLAEGGVVSIREPCGMTRCDGKRPDGATVLPFDAGLPMAWDATIIHTCASSHLHSTAVEAGSGAAAAEAKKEAKYAALSGRAHFRAVAVETLGTFGPSASRLFDEIADRIKSRTMNAGARSRLYARIAAVVQTGNFACIIEAHSRTTGCTLPR